MIIKCIKNVFIELNGSNSTLSFKESEEYICLGFIYIKNKLSLLIINSENELTIEDSNSFLYLLPNLIKDFCLILNSDNSIWQAEGYLPEKKTGSSYNIPAFMFFGYKVIDKDILFNVLTYEKTKFSFVYDFIKKLSPIRIDNNGFIIGNNDNSNYTGRFLYIVKDNEQYFIFIKSSIDNNSKIIDTMIIESEEELKKILKKYTIHWLDV